MKIRLQVFLFSALLVFSCKGKTVKISNLSSFATYKDLREYITEQQKNFKARFLKANEAQKAALVKAAHDTLFKAISVDFFGHWAGTPWSFTGTTEEPHTGAIACGYFVTTVINHSGFEIPRSRWAQLPSEEMIKRMTTQITRFSNRPVAEVETFIKNSGKGLYVVGLDNHTGFILNDGKQVLFVHSSRYFAGPDGVMAQKLDSPGLFKESKYRVVGKLLDNTMVKNWILGNKME